MRFSTYLTENKNLKTEATLVLHKIINMVDNGHVDMNDSDIRFSVGPMIHKGSYDGLKVVIRKAEKISVKLGKTKEGAPVIVIDTKKLPERKKIDSLLSEKDIFDGFVTAFVSYLQNIHDHLADHPKHDAEVEVDNNSNFEDNYNALIAEFTKSNVEAYTKAAEEVQSQVNNNANIIKTETTKLSIKNLQKEYLGTSEAEFLGIVKKLPGFKKFEHLQKELSSKLDSRLKTYFTSSVKPIMAEPEAE
jgi:hypothetical protein